MSVLEGQSGSLTRSPRIFGEELSLFDGFASGGAADASIYEGGGIQGLNHAYQE